MSLDRILLNLKILGCVPAYGRIRRGSNGIIAIENDGWMSTIKRYLFSESRRVTVEEIIDIVNSANEKVTDLINSRFLERDEESRPIFADEYKNVFEGMTLIHKELSAAVNGVENLKSTYHDDPMIISQLDIIITRMNFMINRVCQFL